ncbi:MAG: FtsX-like permease family protein [Ignavibacteria bacterium]|nr:FtsX-like permease family protein [Ignavibacteria bacterium]
MKIPLKYITRNFKSRKLTTGITVAGVTLVVFVLTAVLMMSYGIEKTLKATGSPDHIKITRKAANGEISSIIEGDVRNLIRTLPYIAHNAKGEPIISEEPVVIANLEIKSGGLSNICVRGVTEGVKDLRPEMKIVEGRTFLWGARELIVGTSIRKKFLNASIGDKIKIAGDMWTIVGIFSTDGSGFDSEIWGDATQLLSAFHRSTAVSSITFKVTDVNLFEQIRRQFASDKRLNQFEAEWEPVYFSKQSEILATFIKILGLVITIIFSVGATIGATITMYAAVANRTTEIGTMRSLGFSRRSVLSAFLLESLIISFIGWVIGTVLSMFLATQRVSTLNFSSFSELEFGFAVSPKIIITSLIFALLMGLLGGFLPALRAARLKIVDSLRSA